MDIEAKRHEAQVALNLGFDNVFELGEAPPFPVFLDAFEEALADATRWIGKYGDRELKAWQHITEAVRHERHIAS